MTLTSILMLAFDSPLANKFSRLLLGMGLFAVTLLIPASGQKIVVFDVPGALQTHPWGINNRGMIDGWYQGVDGLSRGFIRMADGHFVTFDGGTGALSPLGTFPAGINNAGAVTGQYYRDNVSHGFVRQMNGRVVNFDVDGAGESGTLSAGYCPVNTTWPNCIQGTYPVSINDSGEIDGFFVDSNWVCHGFIRTPDGKISKFDVPGASDSGPGEGTRVSYTSPGLNALGVIVGAYTVHGYADHGFVRFRDGQIVTFSGPATDLVSVNIFGVVSGERSDYDATGVGTGSDGIVGAIETNREEVFDAPGDPSLRWLFPNQINNLGTITGVVNDDALSGIVHGFVRSADGQMTLFDAGPLNSGACCWQGTQGFGINDSGVVAGLYTDDNWVAHGYVRYPK